MSQSVLDSTILQIVIYVGGTVCAAALIWLGNRVYRGAKRASQFFDDWFGQPARPGVTAVPGVPERLLNVEQLARSTSALVQHELRTNGGSSVKDQLNRIDEATKPS